MNERKPSLEERLASGKGAIGWINEPIDFTVDYTVKAESAIHRAWRRWQHAGLISGDRSERE